MKVQPICHYAAPLLGRIKTINKCHVSILFPLFIQWCDIVDFLQIRIVLSTRRRGKQELWSTSLRTSTCRSLPCLQILVTDGAFDLSETNLNRFQILWFYAFLNLQPFTIGICPRDSFANETGNLAVVCVVCFCFRRGWNYSWKVSRTYSAPSILEFVWWCSG